MATEQQYNHFRAIYEEENKRYEQLEVRARFFLTIETFYLGAIAFKSNDVFAFAKQFAVPVLIYVGAACLVTLGMLLTVWATRIRTYESPSDLRAIIESFGETPPNDSDFLDDRLNDYVTATERNSKVNDKVANLISGTGLCLASAVLLHLVSFLLAYMTSVTS